MKARLHDLLMKLPLVVEADVPDIDKDFFEDLTATRLKVIGSLDEKKTEKKL